MAFDKAPAGMDDSRAWPTALARAIADQLQGALDLCAYRGAGTVARAPIAAGARHYSSFQSAPRLGRPDLVRMRPPADPRRFARRTDVISGDAADRVRDLSRRRRYPLIPMGDRAKCGRPR